MTAFIYRYEFDQRVPVEEVKASLLLAIIGTESLHGEIAAQLGATHYFDADRRVCVVDAVDPVGQDFNSLFAGYLRREFGPDAFHVRRFASLDLSQPTAA